MPFIVVRTVTQLQQPTDTSPCCRLRSIRSKLTSSNTPRGGSVYGASSMSQSQFADPLATPGYDVDPWSGTQSPSRVSTPALPVASTSSGIASAHPDLDAFLGVYGFRSESPRRQLTCSDDPPTAYLALWRQLDPSLSGEISLSTLQRLLGTAQLSGPTVEKVSTFGSTER